MTFTTKGEALPVVTGNTEIIREGIAALECLADLLVKLGKDAEVAEIAIWENAPITALICHDDFIERSYGWNDGRWVEVRSS